MPPRLRLDWFTFKEGEEIPDHIDEFPDLGDRDISKICIVGLDRRTKLEYAVAVDIDSVEVAKIFAKARRRKVRQVQWDRWRSSRDTTSIIEPEY